MIFHTSALGVQETLLTTTESVTSASNGPIISDDVLRIFQFINFTFLGQAIDLFGVITNTINMIVFLKIGFKDSINLSLFGLAISDFLGCLTLVWLNISLTPWFQTLELPFDHVHIQYLTAGWPHVIFTRITGVITMFITFERCLCVILPLKIKTIITRRRVVVFLVSVFVLVPACYIPIYVTNSYAWKWLPELNRSILVLVFSDNRVDVETIHWPIVSIAFPMGTFLFVIIGTALLISSLKKKAKWREAATSGSTKQTDTSYKEKKISTLVATISVLFIICFFPVTIVTLGMVSDREFNITGKRWRLFNIMWSYVIMLESVNSALNVFIYYSKSTNYRSSFDKIFRRKSGEPTSK